MQKRQLLNTARRTTAAGSCAQVKPRDFDHLAKPSWLTLKSSKNLSSRSAVSC
jgi:hypothetical protein